MVISMNNDSVKIYNISEEKYINLLGSDPNNLLQKRCVKEIAKNDFTSEKLTGDAALANFYYYDDGTTMVRKNIDDKSEIEYYYCDKKLWPSKEYYMCKVKSAPKLEPNTLELTDMDYKLNRSCHVNSIFKDKEINEFKKYYDNLNSNNVIDILKGKSYKVNTYMKLILNTSKMGKGKLTAQKLKGSLCLIVTPIGINKDGEVIYSITEFELKNYIDKINSEFIRIKNQNNIKADSMTDAQRYDFLESACKEVISKVQGEILERTHDLVFNSNGLTWQEYCDNFLINYSFSLAPINIDKWKLYSETLLDSRTVHNGFIVPLVEEYALSKCKTDKHVDSKERMNSKELLETPEEIVNENKNFISVSISSDEDKVYKLLELDETLKTGTLHIDTDDSFQKKYNLDNLINNNEYLKVEDNPAYMKYEYPVFDDVVDSTNYEEYDSTSEDTSENVFEDLSNDEYSPELTADEKNFFAQEFESMSVDDFLKNEGGRKM